MPSEDIEAIINEIKQLDISAKQLNKRRTTLVRNLEAALGTSEEVPPIARNPDPFQPGDRVRIINKVTPANKSTGATIKDRRGVVTKVTYTSDGQVKVWLRTDNNVHTFRLSKNVRAE